MDGKSITNLLEGKDKRLDKRTLYWHITSQARQPSCSGIRKGNMKLIQWLASEDLELYDLENDPKEESNLLTVKPELAK